MEKTLEAQLDAVVLEVIKTAEIEGEILNNDQVRSSVARHLGIEHLYQSLATPTREIDAIVEMMLKASFHFNQPLTLDELFAWHRALFPTGYSGLYAIQAGRLRDDSDGAMQVVSGGYGKTKVHFEARVPIDCPMSWQSFFIGTIPNSPMMTAMAESLVPLLSDYLLKAIIVPSVFTVCRLKFSISELIITTS